MVYIKCQLEIYYNVVIRTKFFSIRIKKKGVPAGVFLFGFIDVFTVCFKFLKKYARTSDFSKSFLYYCKNRKILFQSSQWYQPLEFLVE